MSTEPTWKAVRYYSKTIQNPYESERACGCCEKCGQTIRWCVDVISSDGTAMTVGQDCAVTLTGGLELRSLRNAQSAWKREQARIAWEAGKGERDAQALRWKAIEDKARDEHGAYLARLDTVLTSDDCSDYEKRVAGKEVFDILRGCEPATFLTLEEEQLRIALWKAEHPSTGHYKAPAAKFSTEAFYLGARSFEGKFGTKWMLSFGLDTGERLIWWTSANSLPAEKRQGSMVSLKGTIKGHNTYMGKAQTEITRCKIA